MGHRHDQLFQLIFAAPEHAAPLLQTALAPAVVQAIDWATLCRCEPDQRSRRGRRTICDLLFAVTARGGGGRLLYVVLEHKSASSRFDALQMLEQVTAVLRTWRREHPLQYLPAAADDAAAFEAWVATWRAVLQQASRFADETSNEELFLAVVDYVLDTSDLPRQIVHRVLDHQLTDDAMKKKFVSTLTQTRNEGRDEGRVEGRNEGRADLLLRQLARRFGAEAAKAAEQRVRGAVAAELDRFAERVLDARTIDDVFGTADRG